MSVSATQMPWLAVIARPLPDQTATKAVAQNPVLAVQPVPDNPTAHVMPQWSGLPAKTATPLLPTGTSDAPEALIPDLFFPDPLPGLPKIDPPAPKADYPAALIILSGSAHGKLG